MSAVTLPPSEEVVNEAVPDEEAPGDEEIVEGESDVEDEASVDPQALQEAIDALGPDDPAVKALQEKFAPQTVEEERLQWETEKERQARQARLTAARQYAANYEPQNVYQSAYERAYQSTAEWGAALQAAAQDIFNGADRAIDPTKQAVFDADAAAQAVATLATELAQEIAPASSSWVATRMEDTLQTALEQSAVHRQLTRDDLRLIQEAKRLQYADHRAARITAIYLNRAIQGGPQIREQMTKAERAAEKEREKHRETLARAIGGRGAVTAGARASSGRLDEQSAQNMPIDELMKIRSRQR